MKIETYHLIGRHHEARITPLLTQLFGFELGHQAERLATRIRSLEGKRFTIKLQEERRKKTKAALGFYFGGLVRAQVMDDKGLEYDPADIPEAWKEYRKQGKVTLTDFDNADMCLRLEFFFEWILDLQKRRVKVPKLNIDEYKKRKKMDKLTSIKKSDVEEFHKGLDKPNGPVAF